MGLASMGWRAAAEGLNMVIVNPSTVLGYGDWSTSSCAIFKNVYNEFPWYTEGVNGFVDVRDVARTMILLMNSKISGQRYILNAENLSYKEIFSLMAKGFEKKPPSRKVTPFIAEMIWRLEAIRGTFTGKKRMITKETARSAQAIVYHDHDKILNALPQFHFIPIADTIEYTCKSLKKKYHL